LQNVIIYAAGVAADPRDAATARAFIVFMATPEAKRLIREKGMEPG
jgi:ABC-type molybdate transport system substrate-binding protein